MVGVSSFPPDQSGPSNPGWSPPPPSPGSYGAPGWGAPGPQQQMAPYQPPKRPKAVTGGWLMLGAALVLVLGSFLPWVSGGGESFNGFDHYACIENRCGVSEEEIPEYLTEGSDSIDLSMPGVATMLGAVILGSFGIALLAAGRVPALGILAIIGSGFGLLVAFACWYIVNEIVDDVNADMGAGIYLITLGAILGIAGGIATLVQKGPTQPQQWGAAPPHRLG